MESLAERRPTLHEAIARLLKVYYEALVTSPFRGELSLKDTPALTGLTPEENNRATFFLCEAGYLKSNHSIVHSLTPFGLEAIDDQDIAEAVMPPRMAQVVYLNVTVFNEVQREPDPEMRRLLEEILAAIRAGQQPPKEAWKKVAKDKGLDFAINLAGSAMAAYLGLG